MATQCPDCGEYHLASEVGHVEIMREDGRAAALGQSGRIVVTPFYNYAMPLIRYDMGDFAEAGIAKPTCRRRLPTLRRILGRARNRFRFRDGSIIWPELADFRLHELVSYTDVQLLQIDLDQSRSVMCPRKRQSQSIELFWSSASERPLVSRSQFL